MVLKTLIHLANRPVLLALCVLLSAAQGLYSQDNSGAAFSAWYELSALGFSTRSEVQSILTWRDVYMHGGKIRAEVSLGDFYFNKLLIEAGGAASFNGYMTDDDANNGANVIAAAGCSVCNAALDLALARETGNAAFLLGFSYDWVGFRIYDARLYSQGEIAEDELSGEVAWYNQNMIGLYAAVKYRAADTPHFYADLAGLAGLTAGAGTADWLFRSDLEHPVSFSSGGVFFRAGGQAEAALRIGFFTLYISLQGEYQISPWLGGLTAHYSDHTHSQFLFQEFSRASARAGVKFSF